MSDEVNPFSRQNTQQGPYQAPPTPGPRPSGGGRSWILVFGLILAGGAVMLLCCGGLAIFGFRAGAELLTAPVDTSVAALNADEQIAEKLGTPIESTSTVGVQQYNNHNNNGDAKVGFSAKGPKGTARVDGELDLTAGTWSIRKMTVKFPDGTVVKLPRDGSVTTDEILNGGPESGEESSQ
ncbi:MAG: hypothetical protein HKN47_17190 [Pirellulaceae bacterium]|nr:hypothetical protein [Pirellulaceae bacterium]